MPLTAIYKFLLFLLLSLQPSFAGYFEETIEIYRTSSDKKFDEVVADAEFAISEQNFILISRNDIGRAIREAEESDFPEVTILQFCNLDYAKEVLSSNPGFSRHMPCRINIYQSNGKVIVESQFPKSTSGNPELKKLISKAKGQIIEIINFATQPH